MRRLTLLASPSSWSLAARRRVARIPARWTRSSATTGSRRRSRTARSPTRWPSTITTGSSSPAPRSAAHPDIALARFTPGGRLDTAFGHGGKVADRPRRERLRVRRRDPGRRRHRGRRRTRTPPHPTGSSCSGTVRTARSIRASRTAAPHSRASDAVSRARPPWRSHRRDASSSRARRRTASRVAPSWPVPDGRTARSMVRRRRAGDRSTSAPAASSSPTWPIQPDGSIVAAGWAEVSLVPVFSAVRYDRRWPPRSDVRRRRHLARRRVAGSRPRERRRPRGRRERRPRRRRPQVADETSGLSSGWDRAGTSIPRSATTVGS